MSRSIMTAPTQRNTGHRRRRSREAKRLVRDRAIHRKLRLLVALAEHRHAECDEPIEPLSVYYGKENRPASWELSPFPMGRQANGRPMPQWKDLSQWLKVGMATEVCNQWDLLTFNINLHPELERELVAKGSVRIKLAERVRKQLGMAIGPGREYFFVIEGHSKDTGAQTHLHMHGAIVTADHGEVATIKDALARAAGHDVAGRGRVARAVHSAWFTTIRPAYMNYLFKFTLRRDPRLDDKRLVMSISMTQAARDFWEYISGASVA